MTETGTVGVVGAGAWGTALTNLLADQGMAVDLWAFEPEVVEQIETKRENGIFLPGVRLSERIRATGDLAKAVKGKEIVFLVVPSHVYRQVVSRFRDSLLPSAIVVSATKGVENNTCSLMSDIVRELLPSETAGRACFLSGPSFAKEVALRLPTAVTVASRDREAALRVQDMVSCPYFRAYTSSDIVGVELGGALKNVIAIAAGACDGLGLGANARAGLITRGLAEMARLGVAMGASPLTFSGLAGLGDLILTCTGDLSRNRTVGYRLGAGETIEEITRDMVSVAEGVKTSRAVNDLASKMGVEMPISREIYRVIYEGKGPAEAVRELMTRDLKRELEGIPCTPPC